MLSKYLDASRLPPAPEEWDGYLGGKAAPKMYANDRFGNCTTVGLANHARIQAAVDGRELPEFTDQEVADYYFAFSGGQDVGAVETEVLDHAVRVGFPLDGRYKFVARATVDHRSWEALKLASYLFGGVYLGIALPNAVKDMGNHWSVQGDGATGDNAPMSWGGHCVVMSGHDNTPSLDDKEGQPVGNVSIATWGEIVYCTKHWLQTYCDEAHVLLDERHLRMPGVNGNALLADLDALSR